MQKLLFVPFRLVGGLLAGVLSKRLFGAIWGAFDKQTPPRPEQRQVSVGKLVLALALNGAIVQLVRGLLDHASRTTFMRVTGRWPGEQPPPAKPS
jgi:hypothetical protein